MIDIGLSDDEITRVLEELQQPLLGTADDGSWKPSMVTILQGYGIDEATVQEILVEAETWVTKFQIRNKFMPIIAAELAKYGIDGEGVISVVLASGYEEGLVEDRPRQTLREYGLSEVGAQRVIDALDDLSESATRPTTIRSTVDMMIKYGLDEEERQRIFLEAGIDITATLTPTPTPPPTPTATPSLTPAPPDLAIEKLLNSEFHYGQSGSYTFQIGNVGIGTARSPITLVDVLSDVFTFDSYSDPFTTEWDCSASGQQVTCEYTGPDISPGGFLPALIIAVTIAPIEQFPGGSDTVDNCAQVRQPDDVNPENDESCVSTVITPAGAAG